MTGLLAMVLEELALKLGLASQIVSLIPQIVAQIPAADVQAAEKAIKAAAKAIVMAVLRNVPGPVFKPSELGPDVAPFWTPAFRQLAEASEALHSNLDGSFTINQTPDLNPSA